jgi:hypothetical protein
MIDSGATGNFMSTKFAQENNIPTAKREDAYSLSAINGTKISSSIDQSKTQKLVDKMTRPLPMAIGKHHEEITFDLIGIANHEVVLGIPWLRKHNPTIDWAKGKLVFPDCKCTIDVPASLEATDEPKGKPTYWVETDVSRRTRRYLSGRKDGPVHRVWVRPSDQVLESATREKKKLPPQYKEFEKLAEEDIDHMLPKHKPWDHEIKLEPGKHPGFQPIRPLSEKELAVLRDYLEENLKKGYIRPSKSPAGYPILFAPKKDGKLRLCVDYRQLNDITIKNRYPLPVISELQMRIKGAKVFTKIDIREAYHRIRMKEGEEWKTAFRTRYGHYEYLVMPFGLTNAPATMQELVNDTLREYLDKFCVAYLDDILIYSNNKEEHVGHVKKVLRALQEKELLIKPEKCEWHVEKTEFLGHMISTEGLTMTEEKIKAILEWPVPRSVKEVQAFNGLTNYYRKYVKDYSKINTPLTDLTRGDKKNFQWTNEAQKAFDTLKDYFRTGGPILGTFDPELENVIETDASDRAIGAVHSQVQKDGKLKLIAFYSRKLSPAELNYEIHDKELLAIVAALQEWRVCLEGSKHQVQVYTDHKNLLTFTKTKTLNRRQVRWSETLANYNIKILYRRGKDNGRADALSRRPDYFDGEEDREHTIFRETPDGLEYNHRELNATYTVEEEGIIQEIKGAYNKDKLAKDWIEHPPEDRGFKSKDGILYFEGKIYVPSGTMRDKVVSEHHDPVLYGHPGIGKTLEHITRNFYFPGMRKRVEDYVKRCADCNMNKPDRHKPYGSMKTPTIPTRAWKSIAWDFITKLPESTEPMTKVKYDSILVVTDRLTKYCYFLPYMEKSTAEELSYTFLRTVVAQHGLPDEIISDRGTTFTSKFWKSLVEQLGVKHKLSTAYHPQTDGQTERMNQTLEQYLRHYINFRQNDWVSLLPIAQLAYNRTTTETTKVSPFFANYGYEPEIDRKGTDVTKSEKARWEANMIKTLQEELALELRFIAARAAKYYDKKHNEDVILREGDKVYLLRRNIKTKRPSNKLDHVKIGPFRILRNIRNTSYELQLPKSMSKIHPVFHISLLEPANSKTPTAVIPNNYIDDQEGETEYEVEEILDSQTIDGQLMYLVKWKGYDHSEDSWEPTSNLNCPELLQEFLEQQRQAGQRQKPKSQRQLHRRDQPRAQRARRSRQSHQAR